MSRTTKVRTMMAVNASTLRRQSMARKARKMAGRNGWYTPPQCSPFKTLCHQQAASPLAHALTLWSLFACTALTSLQAQLCSLSANDIRF